MQGDDQSQIGKLWDLDFDVIFANPARYEFIINKVRSWNQKGEVEWMEDGEKVVVPILVSLVDVGLEKHFYIKLYHEDMLQITLQFLKTDLYLMGFGTKVDSWYAFKGYVKDVAGSEDLGFGGSYMELEKNGGSRANQIFNWETFDSAVRYLAKYRHGGNERSLKRALINIIYTFSEASRFKPIFKVILENFQGKHTDMEAQTRFIVNDWETLSKCLLKSISKGGKITGVSKEGKKKGKRKNEKSPEDTELQRANLKRAKTTLAICKAT